jgi:hypothetical protein
MYNLLSVVAVNPGQEGAPFQEPRLPPTYLNDLQSIANLHNMKILAQ